MERFVFDCLKEICRKQGMTYKDLANGLDVSEVTVKRFFSQRRCSLEQFHQICDCLHIHPAEVYTHARREDDVFELDRDLESFFEKNYHYFLFYRQICFAKKPEDIRKKFKLTARSYKAYLEKLRDLGLIRIGSKGKVEFLKSKVIKFRPRGNLLKKVRQDWMPYFLDKTMKEGNTYNHLFETASLSLSASSTEAFKIRLMELREEFFQQAEKDKLVMGEDKGVGLLVALGPYRMAMDGYIPNL